jgi:hypothetical protein
LTSRDGSSASGSNRYCSSSSSRIAGAANNLGARARAGGFLLYHTVHGRWPVHRAGTRVRARYGLALHGSWVPYSTSTYATLLDMACGCARRER